MTMVDRTVTASEQHSVDPVACYGPSVPLAEEHPDVLLVRAAVAGDRAAARALIARLAPTVKGRIINLLLRNKNYHAQLRHEADDLVQDVFVALFRNGGEELLRWDPERGMKLESFAGLLAHRLVISVLRSRRLNPFQIAPSDTADEQDSGSVSVDQQVQDREGLYKLAHGLRLRLSGLGLQMFYRLYVWEQSIDVVCRETKLSADAVYQWRSRLRTQAREIMGEVNAAGARVQERR
jgi:DNA-directed RNA polymerase specialized sigma24 family protein